MKCNGYGIMPFMARKEAFNLLQNMKNNVIIKKIEYFDEFTRN